MPKYEVMIKQSEIYVVTVVADSEEEAEELAWDRVDFTRNDYHYGSDSGTVSVEEVGE